MAQFLSSNIEVMHNCSGSNEGQHVENEDKQNKRRYEMRPNVDTFIMDHKQAPEYFLG